MKRKLIAVALITVLVCVGLGNIVACTPPTTEYDLIINSMEGGSVTTPGEGTFTYDEGTVVNLVAEAEEGYQFVNWIGDVGTIANVSAASTTITMNGDYTISANFGDSDGDGLSDTEESQLGTDPNDDHDPGIYCLYNGLYMTKDYFCWQSLGGIDIALNSLVVRRGANAIIGGTPNASITITKSDPALTGLTAAGTGPTWSISIGAQNTVGHYTITLTEGAWSKSIEMYVIFELPQTTTDDGVDCDGDPPNVYDDDDDIYELTDAGLKAYLYDEDSQKDDISVMWFASSDTSFVIPKRSDFQYDYEEWCKGDGYFWHSLYSAGRFDNKQYTEHVFVDHVMQAINGETNQWNAATAIKNYIAPPFKGFTWPNPYFDMFGGIYSDWLDGTSIYGNAAAECSAFAAALCSFLRSAGIPARVVVVDHHAPPPAMNFDHATELWVSDPANPGAQWYDVLARSGGPIEIRGAGWPDSAGDRLMVTAGPDFVIADLDKAKGVDDSMVWLTDPAEGGDSVSAGWWDYHHWYETPYNGADPGWMARKFWVLTENKVYWGITDPATKDGCIWSAEPT